MGADEARELVFAIVHEVGNLVAAVRLQAHLIDEDLGPAGLGRASLELETIGARSSGLLALVRPLLIDGAQAAGAKVGAVLRGVEETLRDVGTRGTALEVAVEPGLPEIGGDTQVLHYLVSLVAAGALEVLGGAGRLRLVAGMDEGQVVLSVEDDGEKDPELAHWERGARRGRVLGCAIAAELLGRVGGRVVVDRRGGQTRVRLILPSADPGR